MPPAGIWIDGLIQSCAYMTMAFGMVLVFSILGILNWTHGQFYMLGAFVVYYAITAVGVPFPLSLLAAGVLVAGLGILVKKIIIDHITGDLYVGVATMGLIFFLEGAASMVFGMQDKGLAMVLPGVANLGSFSVSYQKIAVVSFTSGDHDYPVYHAEFYQDRIGHQGHGPATRCRQLIRSQCGAAFIDGYGYRLRTGGHGRRYHRPPLHD